MPTLTFVYLKSKSIYILFMFGNWFGVNGNFWPTKAFWLRQFIMLNCHKMKTVFFSFDLALCISRVYLCFLLHKFTIVCLFFFWMHWFVCIICVCALQFRVQAMCGLVSAISKYSLQPFQFENVKCLHSAVNRFIYSTLPFPSSLSLSFT